MNGYMIAGAIAVVAVVAFLLAAFGPDRRGKAYDQAIEKEQQ